MTKKKVAIIAYPLSAIRGSEYSVSWNYIIHMYETHDLDIYIGTTGEHLGDFKELQEIPLRIKNNVKIHCIQPGCVSKTINQLNKRKIFTYAFYLAYRLWHRKVYNIIRSRSEQYDVVHFLSPHGYRAPGKYYMLENVKTVWGPIGGFQNADTRFIEIGWMKQKLRTVLNKVQLLLDTSVSKAIKGYDVIFTSHDLNRKFVLDNYGRDTDVIPENGIVSFQDSAEKDLSDNNYSIVWIGSLEGRKGLELLILACEGLNISYELKIIGIGPYMSDYQKLADKLGINAFFLGNLERREVVKHLQYADLHVITSLLEGNPTVLWEAMSVLTPTMSLKNSGMASTICEKCGVMIEMRNREQVISDLKISLESTLNHKTLKTLRCGLEKCRENYLWTKRVAKFLSAYERD